MPGVNSNGNLIDKFGVAYPLHLYSDSELNSFLLEYSEANWLAYEWGLPSLGIINQHRYTATVIREPRERLLSNYIYDYTNGSTRLKLSEYIRNVSIPFWYHEFYHCEVLRNREKQLPSNDVSQVKQYLLDSFDEIWLLKENKFFLVRGEGVLKGALSNNKNKRRVRFYKKPSIDVKLDDYCVKDTQLFESLLSLC